MVILTFAASNWGHLVVVAVFTAVMLAKTFSVATSMWRVMWLLRWLLLFTFLLHLLFTPGRTLWGTNWLSYDGLLVGAFVCAQLLLAVVLATIMGLTTSVDDIVAAVGWTVSPLSRFGVNTAEWEKMTLLSLQFIPVVYEQVERTGTENTSDGICRQNPFGRRWAQWSERLNTFVLGLVERGDKAAHDLIAKDEDQLPSDGLTSLFPLTLLDKLFLLSLVVVVCGYWLAGKLI